MTTVLRTRPSHWRERLALWLLAGRPVCAHVRVPAGHAIEAESELFGDVLFVGSLDLSAYDRETARLLPGVPAEAHGDLAATPGLEVAMPVVPPLGSGSGPERQSGEASS